MGGKTPSAAWRLRPAGAWGMGRLLTAYRFVRRRHQDPRHRVLVDEIFSRHVADVLDRHLLQPLWPALHLLDGHAGGKPPTIVARHARLAVIGIDELGKKGAAGAIELGLRDAMLAQIGDDT